MQNYTAPQKSHPLDLLIILSKATSLSYEPSLAPLAAEQCIMSRYGLDVKAMVRLCITWWVGVPTVRQFPDEFTSILHETNNSVTFRDIIVITSQFHITS